MESEKKKEIDKSLYNEKSLSLLNIRDLRDMGRKFGVPSPTTKNKKELVDYILKIVYGEVEASRSVYGRPNVREFDMNKYVNKIKKNSVINPGSLRFSLGHDNHLNLKVSAPTEDYDIGDLIEQRVFVEDDDRCMLKVHAFVESDDDIEISKDLARKYKLENLDMTEIVLGNNMLKIISINGVKIENKLEGLLVNEKQVKGGTSHIFHHSTKEEIDKEILKIINNCNQIKTKLMVFSPNDYSGEFVQTIRFDEKDTAPVVYKKLMQFVGVCEKHSFETEEFVMVIDRSDLIDELISSLDDDIQERIKKHLHDAILKILSYGNVLLVYHLDHEFNY